MGGAVFEEVGGARGLFVVPGLGFGRGEGVFLGQGLLAVIRFGRALLLLEVLMARLIIMNRPWQSPYFFKQAVFLLRR